MSFSSINPATGLEFAEHTQHSLAEVRERIELAFRAQQQWSTESLSDRIKIIHQLSNVLQQHAEPVARLITREMGKPISQSRAEVQKCASLCRYMADIASNELQDEIVHAGFTESLVTYEALGTVLAIMPWNFPLWQFFRFAVPALLVGNAVLIKHAPNTMGCGIMAARLCQLAGVPLGLVSDLRIEVNDVEHVIADQRIHAITFTGSTSGGAAVAALAGRYVKKSVMELGGSDPYIICDDADIDKAVMMCVTGRTINSGQSCIAAKRFIVHHSRLGEFVQRVAEEFDMMTVGDPMDPNVSIGPIARRDLKEALLQQVERACSHGALIATHRAIDDVPDSGFFVRPALIINVQAGNPVLQEELFGPVATVTSYSTIDEAVDLANNSPFGLGAAICSSDIKAAKLVARKLQCGTVFINDFVRSDARLPFGGVKLSGYGRELGKWGLREFINVKNITIA